MGGGRLRREIGRWRAIGRIKKEKESEQKKAVPGRVGVTQAGRLGSVLGWKIEYRSRAEKPGANQRIRPGAGISLLR